MKLGESYMEETKEKWSGTKPYEEYLAKTKKYTQDKWKNINDGMYEIFNNFAICMNKKCTVDSSEVQNLVRMLQEYITENFYNCSNKILADLGQMYVLDERFKNNIDAYGIGTAIYVSKAIDFYCK